MHLSTSRSHFQLRLACHLLALAAIMGVFAQGSYGEVSTWQCLPEQTALALRIPNGSEFAEAYLNDTKFGSVMFSEKRRQAFVESLIENEPEVWDKFLRRLAEYGLTTDDLWQLFAGESGYAVVVTEDDKGSTLALGLGWLQPGEELAAKIYDALGQAIQRHEDDDHPVTRVNLELADRPVMQLVLPKINVEYPDEYNLPDDYEELSNEEQEAAWKKAQEEFKGNKRVKITYGLALVTTLGDRVFVAHSYQNAETSDRHSDAERLAELLARLIKEHGSGSGGFLAKYNDGPGVEQVISLEGVGAMELLGDVAPVVRLVKSGAKYKETAERVIGFLGLESLGPVAMRSTLLGTKYQTGFFLSAPEPRQGLMRLLDQPQLDPEPPSWVPSNAMRFSQFSFDLGNAYTILKEELTREFPDQAAQVFNMMEAQVVGFASASLQEVLDSLGSRHVAVTFPIDLPETDESGGSVMEPTAIVWQVQDEQLWTRLLQQMIPMVGMMPGGEVADEQGYSGFRFKSEDLEGGLLLGNGNLVFAYGRDVLESTISALNHPPEGTATFRGSDVYERATELVEPRPSCAYQVVDGNRYGRVLRATLMQLIKQQQELAELREENSGATWVKVLEACLPTEKEMENLMGVSASRWDTDAQGIFAISVQDAPPPDVR